MGTFTRDGEADYTGPLGNTETVGANVPRWTYAPYGPLGLLVEDAATTGTAADYATEDDSDRFNPEAGSIYGRFEWQGQAGPLFQLGTSNTFLRLQVTADGDVTCEYTVDGSTVTTLQNGVLVPRQRAFIVVTYGVFGLSLVSNNRDTMTYNEPITLPGDMVLTVGRAGGQWLNGPIYYLDYDSYSYSSDQLRLLTRGNVIIKGLNADRIVPNVQAMQDVWPVGEINI